MRPQASLRRNETSRKKIQSRFSVFTTSSQNKNPAPSVNPGTKQLWQTRCDTSANDEISETNIWFHQQWSTSETNIWWITNNNDEVSDTNVWLYQKRTNDKVSETTSDFIKGEPMKLQTQTSDFIKMIHLRNKHLMDHKQRWCLRNKHLTSSTHDASETPIWHHPSCWPRQYLTATTMKFQT